MKDEFTAISSKKSRGKSQRVEEMKLDSSKDEELIEFQR